MEVDEVAELGTPADVVSVTEDVVADSKEAELEKESESVLGSELVSEACGVEADEVDIVKLDVSGVERVEVEITSTDELDVDVADEIPELSVPVSGALDIRLPELVDSDSDDSVEVTVVLELTSTLLELCLVESLPWVASDVEVMSEDIDEEEYSVTEREPLSGSVLVVGSLELAVAVASLLWRASDVEVIYEDSAESVIEDDSSVAELEPVVEGVLVVKSLDSLDWLIVTVTMGVLIELEKLL
ncbi:hypothetical protein PG993_002507 [Apiospora rasikravindrae]|uniref:Uncharacterized protein n=1 Tax=Apiospora rasikravindrae TaxID=990691 RepID=A0ABR1TWX2_9PEZI